MKPIIITPSKLEQTKFMIPVAISKTETPELVVDTIPYIGNCETGV